MALTPEQQRRVDSLSAPDPRHRVLALESFIRAPDPAPEILAAVEALLEDRTTTILQIPLRYGEVRMMAADAAAALRHAQQRTDPVVLDPCYPSLTADKMGALAREAGVEIPPGSAPEKYAWLRDHGYLPGKRVEFHPQLYSV